MLELTKCITQESTEEDVDAGRESILKALCIYLNEDPDNLFKEHLGLNDELLETEAENTTVGIFTTKMHVGQSKPDDIGIILEGQIVMQELDSVPMAVTLLLDSSMH